MINYGNIVTDEGCDILPSYKPANAVQWTDDANWQLAFADGWRHILDTAPVPDGYTVTAWGYTDAGGVYCHQAIRTQVSIADQQAAAQAAEIARCVQRITADGKWQEAADYRMTMRAEFGDGAETNAALTMAAVFAHYEGLRLSQTITPAQQAAALALLTMYQDLSPYCPTPGDMRTFPWSSMPQ